MTIKSIVKKSLICSAIAVATVGSASAQTIPLPVSPPAIDPAVAAEAVTH
jgi:hypothetical protein